ncbi:hypothetical protein GGTG_04204 [Gaeumannomyces tritici R3-111a-1]|uniref:NADP-dependent oxidoreductase domain-containing protein n=1 Tax=Gaeumannomyces tritici (strain R3-111a-1) TaxID=644352 RepID=J3NSF2_GAET3|nr:hypothetical protein GGTG_04204 [Gaeumannomyces tritici R3-111a-1]EJT79115.1 hypothetical protein GGTG_04204 [Gaeumannomyces tritici R3-111a-1]
MAPTTETKCQYRQLGRSGLRVSVPILGCLGFGDPGFLPWALPEDKALPLLKAAFDRGINTWDTANNYSNGMSEELVGKALKTYGIQRHRVVIMTKCFMHVDEERGGPVVRERLAAAEAALEYQNQAGLSRAAIFNQVDASLRRLDTSYIDLLQIHRYDPAVAPEETMRALEDLVRGGKVRYIGASSMWATQFARLQAVADKHGWTRFVSMQNFYNLLYREEEREMNRFCRETGVAIIPWSPLDGGRLARLPAATEAEDTARTKTNRASVSWGRPKGDNDDRILERVHEIAQRHGCSMAEVALAWLLNGRATSPIVGATKIKHVDEAILAVGIVLDETEEKYLQALYKPINVYGHM